MKKLFIYSDELEKDGYPADCPFSSKRAGLTYALANKMGLFLDSLVQIESPVALTDQETYSFHKREYIEAIKKASQGELPLSSLEMGLGTADCPIFPSLYPYSLLAAGGSITGAKAILSGDADIVFNPSGGFHHAHAAHASGFCYINDIVLSALTFLQAGLRPAIIDIDVHHCDGVQKAFNATDQVLTLSLHQDGKTLFPGTGAVQECGEGDGYGFSCNVPLPEGTYNKIYNHVFCEIALPLLNSYNPDVIILELGMDTLTGDPLAHLQLTNTVLVDVVQRIMALKKPILATGGGGYHVENTVRGWTLLWSVLSETYEEDLSLGMGGVMLANADWVGGLRDQQREPFDPQQKKLIDSQIDTTIEEIKDLLFPLHSIKR